MRPVSCLHSLLPWAPSPAPRCRHLVDQGSGCAAACPGRLQGAASLLVGLVPSQALWNRLDTALTCGVGRCRGIQLKGCKPLPWGEEASGEGGRGCVCGEGATGTLEMPPWGCSGTLPCERWACMSVRAGQERGQRCSWGRNLTPTASRWTSRKLGYLPPLFQRPKNEWTANMAWQKKWGAGQPGPLSLTSFYGQSAFLKI